MIKYQVWFFTLLNDFRDRLLDKCETLRNSKEIKKQIHEAEIQVKKIDILKSKLDTPSFIGTLFDSFCDHLLKTQCVNLFDPEVEGNIFYL